MDMASMAFLPGGHLLVGCDKTKYDESIDVSRLHLWDAATGKIVHQLTTPGRPVFFDTSRNGRYLVALVDESDGASMVTWRLDGEDPPGIDDNRPAADAQRPAKQ